MTLTTNFTSQMTLHNTGSMVIVKLTTTKETTMETEEEVTIIIDELDTKETTIEITRVTSLDRL